jgi:hypothetical protein
MEFGKTEKVAMEQAAQDAAQSSVRLPYTAPALDSLEGKLSALLGSACPINPETGEPAQ